MEDESTRIICSMRKTLLKRGFDCALLCCALIASVTLSHGQEGRALELPDGEGKQLTTFVCTQCHSLRETLVLRDGQKGWEKTVNRMVLYGAQLTPAEAELVTHYLSAELGPVSNLAGNGAASAPVALRDHAGKGSGKPEMMSLPGGTSVIANKTSLPEGPGRELIAERCISCHTMEKVVSSTRSKEDWVLITNNMAQRGMKATPNEIQVMIAYLQTNYGK